jgi:hypothetical protein
MEPSRSAPEHLAAIVVQLLAEAAAGAEYCERVARLKQDDAAAAGYRSVLAEIEDAARAIASIRDSLTATLPHEPRASSAAGED